IDEQYIGQEVECGSCFQTFVAQGPRSRRRSRDDDDDDDRRPVRRRRRDDDDDDDDDDTPRRRRIRRRTGGGGNTAAAWALTLGILSLPLGCCCGLFALPLSIGAVATGAVGMKNPEGKGMAVAGMVLGIIGIALAVIVVVIGIGMNLNNPGQFKRPGR